MALVLEILLKAALAGVFSGACAYAYLRLARKRKDVRRESLLVFGALMLFTFVRLLAISF
jgi:H+/Cl- antiporter ClcA